MKRIISKILIIAIAFSCCSCAFKVADSIDNVNDAVETNENIESVSNDTAGYTVKWLNYDGAVLEIDNNVAKNSFPHFDDKIPARKQNGNVYYIFAGWKPEISKVTNDIIYTALFVESDRKVKDGMEIGKYTEDESLLNVAIMTDPHVPYESRYSAFGTTNVDVLKNRIENAIDKQGATAK